MTSLHRTRKAEEPKRAYVVTERLRGEADWLVWAYTAKDARARFERGDRGMALDQGADPRGVVRVRREPSEDL